MRHKVSFILCTLSVLFACCLSGCLFGARTPSEKNPSEKNPTGEVYDLSSCTFECHGLSDFAYDGSEKKCKIKIFDKDGNYLSGYDPDKKHDDLDAVYSDNINAGTATVTLTAKSGSSRFTGQATCNFTINRCAGKASDEETLRAYLSDGNHDSVTLTRLITAEQPLTVPQDVSLYTGDWRLTCGDLNIEGYLRMSSHYALEVTGNLTVWGKLTLGGDMRAHGTVCNNGTICDLGGYECLLYTDAQPTGEGTYDNVALCYRRALSECDVTLQFTQSDYLGHDICPSVSVCIDDVPVDKSEFSVTYDNNLHVGTATVTVTANALSRIIAGKTMLPFTISPAERTARTFDELKKLLPNPDVDRIVFTNQNGEFVSRVTVPQGKTLTIDDCKYDTTLSDVTVAGTLVVDEGQTVFTKDSLEVTGKFINNGAMFVASELSMKTTIENNGAMFVNDNLRDLLDVRGTSPSYRTPLTENDVHLQADRGNYTGSAHVVTPIFDAGGDEPRPLLTYVYLPNNVKATTITDVGDISVILSANRASTRYYGETELMYRIDPVSATVTSVNELNDKSAIGVGGVCANYNPINIDFDCTLPSTFTFGGKTEFIVPENRTLTYTDNLEINNGSKLTINGSFFQIGTLYINGEFANNGTAYFNGSVPSGVTGTGSKIVRAHINTLSVSCPAEVVYDGTEQTMQPPVTVDGLAQNADYGVKYSNCSSVTEYAPAQAIVTTDKFNRNFYGTITLNYKILPGVCSVASFDELLAATSSVRTGTTICNWKTITVTADLSVQPLSGRDFPKITVHPDTTVVFDSYKLIADGTYSKNFKFTNNGTVKMKCEKIDGNYRPGGPGAIYCTAESKGKYIGYADSEYAFTNLSRRCNEIYLSADLATTAGGSISIIPLVDLASGGALTIDLQNHTIKANILDLSLTYGALTIKNGTITGASTTKPNCRFKVGNTAADRKLTFQNVVGPDDSEFELWNADKNHIVGVTL